MIYRCLYTGVQPMNVCPGRAWLTIAITVKLIVSLARAQLVGNMLLEWRTKQALEYKSRVKKF